MAISIDYGNTNVISIELADLTLVSGTFYTFDTNTFRTTLKGLEDDETGIVFSDTHNHNTEVSVAGTTFARTIEILTPYSVEFPDMQITVQLTGSNNNIFDVGNAILVQNQAQVIPTNSAGLITTTVGSGLSSEEQERLEKIWQLLGLDPSNPVTHTPTSTSVDDVSITHTGDQSTSITSTRS